MCFNHLMCAWNVLGRSVSLTVLSFSTIGAGFENASEAASNDTTTPEDVIPTHIEKSTIGWMVFAAILFLIAVGATFYIGRRRCRGSRRAIKKASERGGQWPRDLLSSSGFVRRLDNLADGGPAPVVVRAPAPAEENTVEDIRLNDIRQGGRERATVPQIVNGSDG